MSENSVGKTPVSDVLRQRQAKRGGDGVESPLGSKPGSNFPFDKLPGVGARVKRT